MKRIFEIEYEENAGIRDPKDLFEPNLYTVTDIEAKVQALIDAAEKISNIYPVSYAPRMHKYLRTCVAALKDHGKGEEGK